MSSIFSISETVSVIRRTENQSKNHLHLILLTAPNQYSIPTVLGSSKEGKIRSAPAYTIIGRQKQTLPQVVQFPGPGTYDGRYDTIQHKAPHFTMAERIGRGEKALGPGPGAHFPEKVLIDRVN